MTPLRAQPERQSDVLGKNDRGADAWLTSANLIAYYRAFRSHRGHPHLTLEIDPLTGRTGWENNSHGQTTLFLQSRNSLAARYASPPPTHSCIGTGSQRASVGGRGYRSPSSVWLSVPQPSNDISDARTSTAAGSWLGANTRCNNI
jgi:hypothetical protein